MIDMVQAHGYWWPKGSEDYCIRYVKRASDLELAIERTKEKGVAVQAGGHCGVWPLYLAENFATVYTFEPDAANFACLSRNLAERVEGQRVFAARGVLADYFQPPIDMSINKVNIGGHKAKREPGTIPAFSIDRLRLTACDLIVLDVEGMEVPALMGSLRTIEEFHPILMLEDCDHGDRYGWGGREELRELLNSLHYEIVAEPYKSKDIICAWRSA